MLMVDAGEVSVWWSPGSLSLGPREPMLTVTVGGKPLQFLVDMGADVSIVTQAVALLLNKKINVQGATGRTSSYFFL